MQWTSEETQIVAAASICALQIFIRSIVRIGGTLKWFPTMHQKWHADDSWMAISLAPLTLRTLCISWAFSLERPLSKKDEEMVLKLVIPGRLAYAIFLWCMKLCLLQFYTRMETGSIRVHRALQILRIVLFLTIIIIILATLLECRPLYVAWRPDYANHPCRKGTVNLLTMATLNIATDIALILFPIPLLWRMKILKLQTKMQLTLLFLVGLLVVAVTITRVPLIFSHSVAQESRTMWASVEIVCASVAANAAFYYALWKDVQLLRRSPADTEITSTNPQSPVTSARTPGAPLFRVAGQNGQPFHGRDSLDIADYHSQLNTPSNASFICLDQLEAGEHQVRK